MARLFRLHPGPQVAPAVGGGLPFSLPNGLSHSVVTDLVTGTLQDAGGTPLVSTIPASLLAAGSAQVITIGGASGATNGTNLLNEFNNWASRGTNGKVIVLTPGEDYDLGANQLVFPGLSGSQWMGIVSSTYRNGTFYKTNNHRVGAGDSNFPRILNNNNTGILITQRGNGNAGHLWLGGLWFAPSADDATDFAICLGTGDTSLQTQLSECPRHFGVSHCVVAPLASTDKGQGGIGANCGHLSVRDCRITDWKSAPTGSKTDPQAIYGWNGPGPFLIDNNYLEAAGENIGFGGGNNAATVDLIPSDGWIRHNYVKKPNAWNPNDPGYGGVSWDVKNLIEFKCGQRFLIEDNVFENSWASAQFGQAITLYSVNQGGVSVNATWTKNEHFHWRYNEWRNCATWLQITARGQEIANPLRRHYFAHNVVIGLAQTPLLRGAHQSYGVKIGRNAGSPVDGLQQGISDLQLINNTFLPKDAHRTSHTSIMFENPPIASGGGNHANLVIRDNIFGNGDYGLFSSDGIGSSALSAHTTGATYEENVHVEHAEGWGDWSLTHPGGTNQYPVGRSAVGFVNESTEDYRLSGGSSFLGTGTNGASPGADVATITTRVNGVVAGDPS